MEQKKENEKHKTKEKRGKSPKKSRSGPVENKTSLPKYTNYYAFNAPQDHIYAMTDKSLFKKLDVIRSDRSHRDVRRNYSYHKDIGHNTDKCNALRDEIERLIRAGHFREEFLENEQVVNTNK